MMLEINEVRQIKITKVKSWAICFNYKDKKYLLHETSEDDTVITLYEKTIVDGKTKLDLISSAYGGMIILTSYVSSKKTRQHMIYSHIDLYDFVAKLVNRKLVTSDNVVVVDIIDLNNKRKVEIEQLQKKIREIQQMLI
jgi:hypothetical protein